MEIPYAAPPWPGIGKCVESLCRKALHQFSLLEEEKKLSVALSGGKDSLTLLFLLHAILGRGFPKLDLFALHVEGEFSCGAGVSKRYLERICQELNIPLIVRTAKFPEGGLECYRCARERRTLLFEAAKEAGAPLIAFGHHRDDSVNTLMMNLLHKGEFAAMLPKVPMKRFGVTLIRPLLFVEERQLVEFAKRYGFARVTCQCPLSSRSMRKQTDAAVSSLEELFPHARANLARAGLLYGSDKALRP
ncbi:MAG TPA: tRNA 2-thiocytidine biosynthesis protein TtcA [Parachlamydiales bacterium]|nr:MAG: tRNA 2-thiocytidine(32) synthetase TtcA [Chlamydiae bacterium RIFCSPHIGHO2_02_FULL_49_29]OGN71887.1 MAG: tRNA 2-thiocytidine(32) synthetase TtcA [Chlamydiae bacterium RIFCSPLOWO2_02_FULL_49_12]HAZ15478.1 tRNA 2-thiocytidine biosynthesis protein TtcA [Parachlamydiales bacterium]